MHISIAERLRPFCHLPGTSTILPGQGYQVQIFPCLIRLYHLQKSSPSFLTELHLGIKGPIQQFTICNDLEKGRITVSGKTAEGWMRYHLISAQQGAGVRCLVERAPTGGFPIEESGVRHLLYDKQWLDLLGQGIAFEPYQIPHCDRLSLGNHKAQDWELVRRRFHLVEYLPILHRLGQLIPSQSATLSREGTLCLLEDCEGCLAEKRPEQGEEKWNRFLLGCLQGMCVPQLEDHLYQGIVPTEPLVLADLSPLIILSQSARLIRKLFIQQNQEELAILPYLLPSFACGRLIDVLLDDGGMLSLEWTKKTIRYLTLYAGQDRELALKFHSHVSHYRLRQEGQAKGEAKSCRSSLMLKKHCRYVLDQFQ